MTSAMRSMPLIVLFPVFKYFFLLGWIAYFSVIYALLATSGQSVAASVSYFINNQTETLVGKTFEVSKYDCLPFDT